MSLCIKIIEAKEYNFESYLLDFESFKIINNSEYFCYLSSYF